MKVKKIKISNRYLSKISAYADESGVKAFLIGGSVRDILLGEKNLDLDIVCEGGLPNLIKKLSVKWNAAVKSYPAFGTYILELKDGNHIDFATARREKYPVPGSLPVVSFSTLKEDLCRRDFTVNAMAMCLNNGDFGSVIDLYGGLNDLKYKRLRVLHDKSFQDDPTRILRLARFAGRGFKIVKSTEKLAVKNKKYLLKVSPARIKEEIIAILSEPRPLNTINILKKWDVFKLILPGIILTDKINGINGAVDLAARFKLLFSGLSFDKRKKIMNWLGLSKKLKKQIEQDDNSLNKKALISGADLIKMGYKPGPVFKKILNVLKNQEIPSRQKAVRFIIDKFPQKR